MRGVIGRTPAAALFLILGVAPATAAQPQLGKFVHYEMSGLTLLTDHGDQEARQVVEELAKFRILLEKTLTLKAENTAVPTHIVIVSGAEWDKYLRTSESVAGWFQRTPFANYLAINGDSEGVGGNPLHVVLHEYTHYILRSQFANDYPAWFNEGLAETMSYVTFDQGHTAHLEIPIMRRFGALIADWIPFERMLHVDYDSPEYQGHKITDGFYSQAWLTVHYGLYENKQFGAQMFEYLSQVNRMVAIDEAARSAFGANLADVDRRLKLYARSTAMQTGTVQLGSVPRADLGIGKPVAEADALAELINLMLELRIAPDRVRAAIGALNAREPDSTRSAVLRARAAQLAKDDRDLFLAMTAAENRLAPEDWESRRELALVLLERSHGKAVKETLSDATRQDLERALAWFGEALAQNPEDVESLWGDGTAATDLHSNLDLAERYLLAAYAQQPTNTDVALALANYMGTNHRSDELVVYLKDLVRYETDLTTRKWAADTLAETEKYLVERQRIEEENRKIEEENRKIDEENAARKAKRRKWF